MAHMLCKISHKERCWHAVLAILMSVTQFQEVRISRGAAGSTGASLSLNELSYSLESILTLALRMPLYFQ